MMDLLLIKLGRCAGKDGIDFALVEALAVAVEEGYVAYRGPAILDNGCRMELGHGVYGVRVSTKLAKKMRGSSESVRFWTDAGLLVVLIRTFFM